MNLKQIEEAMEYDPANSNGNLTIKVSHYKTLLDLAQLYFQASEVMPEKLEPTHGWAYEEGANNMLERCTLALIKRLEGVEDVIKKWAIENRDFMMSTGEWSKSLAQAIREFILGGEK